MPLVRQCEVCGSAFETDQCMIDKGYGRFCSRACFGIYQQKRVTLKCLQCGSEFVAHVGETFRKFCTQQCYWQHKRQRIQLTCQQCGKPFETTQGEIDKSHERNSDVKYCSRQCWAASTTGSGNRSWKGGDLVLQCEQCKKTFSRDRTWPKGFKHIFCSDKCRVDYMRADGSHGPNWRGGVTALHNDERKTWQMTAWRKAVYERDDYTCQDCYQRGGRLHAHHLYPFSSFPHLRFSIANGRTLCKKCHLKVKNHEFEYLKKLGYNPLQPPLLF